MTKIVGYIRVSTAKQEISPEAQRSALERYADLYELTLVEVITETGSAKSLARPGLQRALALLKAGEADGILIAKLDRLTRSVVDLGTLLQDYFRDRWALLSVGDQIDTRSAAGRLILNVLTSVAEWEREAGVERTRAAMAQLKAEGRFTGGWMPYGSTVDGDYLQPIPAEQAVITAAKALHGQGLSLRKIAAELLARGHRSRAGTTFSACQISRML